MKTVATIMSLIYNSLRLFKDIIVRYDTFKRDRSLKKSYKEAEKAVKNGDVDTINEIITKK